MAERLRHATSAYLLQHKDNPVDWWEWGSGAFVEAARRKVPVLLSVGYASCHWCHVSQPRAGGPSSTAKLLVSCIRACHARPARAILRHCVRRSMYHSDVSPRTP